MIIFRQINANFYEASTEEAAKLVEQCLSYKSKIKTYNVLLGRYITDTIVRKFYYINKGKVIFPAGLLPYIKNKTPLTTRTLIKAKTIIYPHFNRKLLPALNGIVLEPYQSKILRKIGGFHRGVIVGPTGMGKSIILGGILDKFHYPEALIIVPNQTIFKQLNDHLIKWFGPHLIGQIGQGIHNQQRITICLYQSLKKYKVTPNLRFLLIDEVHLINDTITKFIRAHCKNIFYRFGVTATPQKFKNNFVKAAQMTGYIGPIIFEIKDSEVSKRVLPVKVLMVNFYCNSPTGENYMEVLRNDILQSTVRNYKLIQAAYTHALKKGMTCLFLVDETHQAKQIVKIAKDQFNIDITIAHAKLKKSIIQKIVHDLNNYKIQCVVATKVFGTGTDIPNIDCVVLASARKSEIDTLQKIGRGRRRTEKGLDYLLLIDSIDRVKEITKNKKRKKYLTHFYNHSIERMEIYKKKQWEIIK